MSDIDPRPEDDRFDWAESGNLPPTEQSQLPEEPPQSRQDTGWGYGEPPPHRFFNWIIRAITRWIFWLEEKVDGHVHDGGEDERSVSKVDLDAHIDYRDGMGGGGAGRLNSTENTADLTIIEEFNPEGGGCFVASEDGGIAGTEFYLHRATDLASGYGTNNPLYRIAQGEADDGGVTGIENFGADTDLVEWQDVNIEASAFPEEHAAQLDVEGQVKARHVAAKNTPLTMQATGVVEEDEERKDVRFDGVTYHSSFGEMRLQVSSGSDSVYIAEVDVPDNLLDGGEVGGIPRPDIPVETAFSFLSADFRLAPEHLDGSAVGAEAYIQSVEFTAIEPGVSQLVVTVQVWAVVTQDPEAGGAVAYEPVHLIAEESGPIGRLSLKGEFICGNELFVPNTGTWNYTLDD